MGLRAHGRKPTPSLSVSTPERTNYNTLGSIWSYRVNFLAVPKELTATAKWGKYVSFRPQVINSALFTDF